MTQAEAGSGRGFTRALGFVIAAAVFANVAYHVSWILRESDLWWHIRSGQLMLESWRVPYTDTFSYTHAGQPWIAKEWLSQVVFASVFALGGWAGPLVLTAVVMAFSAWLFYRSAAQSLHPFYAAVLTLLAVFLVQGVTVARPHILTFPLAVGLTVLLFGTARDKARPPFWSLALIILWSNLHGSFPLAFVIAGCALIDVVERTRFADKKLVLLWALYIALGLLVTLVNPYFIKPYQVALGLAGGLQVMREISEWAPFTVPQDRIAEVALLAVVAFLLKVRARFTVGQILFVLATLNMMFTYTRFIYVFFWLVPLALLPEIVAAAPRLSWQHWSARQRDKLENLLDRHGNMLGGVCAVAVLIYATALVATPSVTPPEDVSISKAIAYVEDHRESSPALQKQVFNDYNFGGPLVLAGIPTYIDGRSDQLFMGDFLIRYLDSGDPRGVQSLLSILDDVRIGWTVFPLHDPRNAALAQQPGWKKTYADDTAVIYERQ